MSRKKAVKGAREELGAGPVFLCKGCCIVKLVPNTSSKRTLNLSSGVCPKSITKASLVITKSDMPCLTVKVKCEEQNNKDCVQTCCSVSHAGGGSRISINVPANHVWLYTACAYTSMCQRIYIDVHRCTSASGLVSRRQAPSKSSRGSLHTYPSSSEQLSGSLS